MTIFPGAFISTRGHFRCSTYHLPMMSIRQNGSVNKDFEGNFTLKFFQRVYRLTPWVVATFENGRAVLPLYESEIRASQWKPCPDRAPCTCFAKSLATVPCLGLPASATVRESSPPAALPAPRRAAKRERRPEGPPSVELVRSREVDKLSFVNYLNEGGTHFCSTVLCRLRTHVPHLFYTITTCVSADEGRTERMPGWRPGRGDPNRPKSNS